MSNGAYLWRGYTEHIHKRTGALEMSNNWIENTTGVCPVGNGKMSDKEVIELLESKIKQFASDLEAQEYYCLAEEALKCLEVDQ